MWTNENSGRYDRSKLRYPSDLTDEERGVTGPLIGAAKKGGNKRTIDERAVANGMMSILSTGCQWPAPLKDLPPRSAVNDYFCRWDDERSLDRIHHALYVKCWELAEREDIVTVTVSGGRTGEEDSGGMTPPPDPHYRHRFPAEIISHVVWLYYVFSLETVQNLGGRSSGGPGGRLGGAKREQENQGRDDLPALFSPKSLTVSDAMTDTVGFTERQHFAGKLCAA